MLKGNIAEMAHCLGNKLSGSKTKYTIRLHTSLYSMWSTASQAPSEKDRATSSRLPEYLHLTVRTHELRVPLSLNKLNIELTALLYKIVQL